MFTLVTQCAEPITQSRRPKAKVTIEGHEFSVKLSFPFDISLTFKKIFMKLWSNVHHSKTLYKIYCSSMSAQGQGHSRRPRVFGNSLLSAPYLMNCQRIFIKL